MPVSKRRKPKRSRPTPPPPSKEKKPSPLWYVVIMFSLMAIGVAAVVLSYLGLLPTETDQWYRFGGLGAIALGFLMTMSYR
jgi:hypothetical protein